VPFEGDVAFGAENVLAIELDGHEAGRFDQLEVLGAARLGGTLRVVLLDSGAGQFLPQPGDQFPFLSARDGITGAFDMLQLPDLPSAMAWSLSVMQDRAVLAVAAALAGDYNFDGMVDAADYIIWRSTLDQTGTSLAADGNGNGVIDNGDYEVWRANFGTAAIAVNSVAAGASEALATVPEPRSAALLLVISVGAVVSFSRIRVRRPLFNPGQARIANESVNTTT
jgi:hypothetical protein